MKNKVYLVGAGPGRPDLITVRGLNILRQADVVIYDYLVGKQILSEAKPGAELICCDKLGKKRYSDGFSIHNEKVSELVVKKAKGGKQVIRLKNGDVSIFSRLSQELDALVKNGIEFEIVPGVTAASAAACFSGIPLTERRYASSCVLVTGHEDSKKITSLLDWESLSKSGTLILYMALETLPNIAKQLIKVGKSKDIPVAIVQDVSLVTQRLLTGTLKNIALKAKKQRIKPPIIIIVGEVVKLEKNFNWLKKTKKILFTGISAERYFKKGFVFHLPLIKIEPLKNYKGFDSLIKNIDAYDWIVFASCYGVKYFFARLKEIGYDARVLKNSKIAAIGNSTRNYLLNFGILADLVPKEESSNGLLKAFKKIDIKTKTIFMPRSDLSDKGLEFGLKKQGAIIDSAVAYRNVMPKDLPDLDLRFFDEIKFSSPSGVRNFVKRYTRHLPKKIKVRCIGGVTLKEVKRCLLRN